MRSFKYNTVIFIWVWKAPHLILSDNLHKLDPAAHTSNSSSQEPEVRKLAGVCSQHVLQRKTQSQKGKRRRKEEERHHEHLCSTERLEGQLI